MTRARVLRVIARMNVGGPALQVTALMEGLDRDRYDQRLLVGSVGPGEADYVQLRAPHLSVERVRGLGRAPAAGDDLRALTAIAGVIRRFRPHIVHTHTAKAGVLGRLAAFALHAPHTVHTFHGHLLHGYFSPRVTAAVRTTERVLARRTTRLVAVGTNVRDELLAAGVGRADQYAVVPPGVTLPCAPSPAEARRRLGLDGDGQIVAFVGRLAPVKRADRFLAAARRIVAARPEVRFVIAGEGELFGEVRRLGEPLGNRLHLLGWRPDVETVYAACDVVALTSDNEGMPVSLIEAAMAGRPAVTTRVGSAPEVVVDGETGLVTGADDEEIADAILRLLDDEKLRAAFGVAAARRARQLFSAERLVADIDGLYAGMLGNR